MGIDEHQGQGAGEEELKKMNDITETMPENMPKWMWDAIDAGQLALRSMELVAELQEENKKLKEENEKLKVFKQYEPRPIDW